MALAFADNRREIASSTNQNGKSRENQDGFPVQLIDLISINAWSIFAPMLREETDLSMVAFPQNEVEKGGENRPQS